MAERSLCTPAHGAGSAALPVEVIISDGDHIELLQQNLKHPPFYSVPTNQLVVHEVDCLAKTTDTSDYIF